MVAVIFYVHAVFFVGWLLLLLVKTGLFQTREVKLHQRMGLTSIGFGAVFFGLGVWYRKSAAAHPRLTPTVILCARSPKADPICLSPCASILQSRREMSVAHESLPIWLPQKVLIRRFPTFKDGLHGM